MLINVFGRTAFIPAPTNIEELLAVAECSHSCVGINWDHYDLSILLDRDNAEELLEAIGVLLGPRVKIEHVLKQMRGG
jgi:hypothetical protein